MRTSRIVFLCVVAGWLGVSVEAEASLFEVELSSRAIYTPGKVIVTARLAENAVVEGDYHFRVSLFAADVVVGEKLLGAKRDETSVFEVEFPVQRDRTDARCRVELYLNEQFVESREVALGLWPAATAYAEDYTDKTIWLIDASGKLQKIFDDLKIEAIDAGGAVFSKPSAVFFGEETDAAVLRRMWYVVKDMDPRPVVVLLRQKEFPGELGVAVESSGGPDKVGCVGSSRFLKELGVHDLMGGVRNAAGVRIVPEENEFVFVEPVMSCVEAEGEFLSYLGRVERGDIDYVYCQLPVVDDFGVNPVSGLLLRNVIAFVCDDVVEMPPVIYRDLPEAEKLTSEQLESVLEAVGELAPEEGKIWFVRVLCNEISRADTFSAVVYFRPEYSSERLRKGKFLCIGGSDLTEGTAVCQEYCQVSSSERKFAFELEVGGQDLLFPCSRGENVSDEEVVGAVDCLAKNAKSGSGYSELKGDEPIFSMEKKDGLIEVRVGVKDSSRSGAGHIFKIRSYDGKFDLVNVFPW